MSWRTVVITKQAKLSFKNGYLVVRGEDVQMIHLSEINTVIIDSTAVVISSYLISELLSLKIKIVFCDNKRNPQGEVLAYYGSHNTSKRIAMQIQWSEESVVKNWTTIIRNKILNQADHLKMLEIDGWQKICEYVVDLKTYDTTNREGHAAKVYFNSLFGKGFSRDDDNDINAALNYGYSILLSNFNKEIVACGYITQIGIKHRNEYNQFNLTSDLMEPFRVLVDAKVYQRRDREFNSTYKVELVDILNSKVRIENKEQFLTTAIRIYVKSVFKAIEKNDEKLISFFDFE